MSSAVAGRFPSLLRWLGITLVVLLALQLLAVLSVNGWDEDSFRQLLSSTLITQSPMALVGICLLYTSPSPRDRTRSRMPSSA